MGLCGSDVAWPGPGAFTVEEVTGKAGRSKGLCDPLLRVEENVTPMTQGSLPLSQHLPSSQAAAVSQQLTQPASHPP